MRQALALAIPEAPARPVAGNHRLGCGIGVVASNLNQACHLPEWFRGCAGFNLRANAPRRTSGYERYLVVGHQVWRPSVTAALRTSEGPAPTTNRYGCCLAGAMAESVQGPL
jgi:hypothetical protein